MKLRGVWPLGLLLTVLLVLTGLTEVQSRPRTITFSTLKDLIQDKQITSIEALLPFLPEAYRSKYVLMFKSRSLHNSSFTNPRAILFGDDASFVISFNGLPEQKGFNALETMEYVPKTREFVFREIEFPLKGTNSAQVSFSESNPIKCLRCHGEPAHPVWDTWPVWPGAYGERYHAPLADQEQKELLNFLAGQPTHPRYKYLLRTETFANKETFNPSHENRYNGRQKVSPNEELSRLLSEMNIKMIAEIVRKANGFDAFKYALLASLIPECGGTGSTLPEALRADFLKSQKAFSLRSEERNEEQLKLKKVRTLSAHDRGASLGRFDIVSLNSFRFIVETGLGISTDPWTTALEKGTYDFTGPQPVEASLERLLLRAVAASDSTLNKLASIREVSSSDSYCLYLRKQSRAALNGWAPSHEASLATLQSKHRPTPIKTCISCHDGSAGPPLPFEKPENLAKLLKSGKYPRGTLLDEIHYRLSPAAGADRMPVGLNLTEDERGDLENYFRRLKENPGLKSK